MGEEKVGRYGKGGGERKKKTEKRGQERVNGRGVKLKRRVMQERGSDEKGENNKRNGEREGQGKLGFWQKAN